MKRILATTVAAILFASCHHVYYAPNTANAPLLSEKGETRINALYSVGNVSEFSGGELQLATAVSKRAGVMLNFFSAGKSDVVSGLSGDDVEERGSGSYLEAAAGLFHPFGAGKAWIAEVYGGGGIGSATNEYGLGDRSKVGITKYFIQPSFGYKSNGFEVAVVPKVSMIRWNVKESSIRNSRNESVTQELNYIKENPSFVAFEPAVLLRGGSKNFKVQLGVSFCNYAALGYLTEELHESATLSLRISINIKSSKKQLE